MAPVKLDSGSEYTLLSRAVFGFDYYVIISCPVLTSFLAQYYYLSPTFPRQKMDI